MPLLDWLQEDRWDDNPKSFPGFYLIPVTKRVWGTFRTAALNEEDALEVFYGATEQDVQEVTEWLDYVEYEYDSCGVIEHE